MEIIPKDVVEKITNELSPQDFINYCRSMKSSVCKSNEVFFRRMQRDFPFMNFSSSRNDAKKVYLKIFSEFSEIAEKVTKITLDANGESFSKYLTLEYKKDLYLFYYRAILNTINDLIRTSNRNNKDEQFEYFLDNISGFFEKFTPKFMVGIDSIYGGNFLDENIYRQNIKEFIRKIITHTLNY